MHRQTVLRHLRALGIPLRSEQPLLSETQLAEVITRYQAGDPATVLGKVYGLSDSTIRKQLREAGVTIRPRGKPSQTRARTDL
jgi:hypothetical protein